MKKKEELFFFFSITNVTLFKQKLKADIKNRITTTTQLLSVSTQPITALNIAFSQTGLVALGVADDLGDFLFTDGQEAHAPELGDPGVTGTDNWVSAFLDKKIHGVLLLASDSDANLNNFISDITSILQGSVKEIYRLKGAARPGSEEGHERKILQFPIYSHLNFCSKISDLWMASVSLLWMASIPHFRVKRSSPLVSSSLARTVILVPVPVGQSMDPSSRSVSFNRRSLSLANS